MIDPHVHLRDWDQSHKETVLHGLRVAYAAGLDATFEMPNTSPALDSRDALLRRADLGDTATALLAGEGKQIFHGMFGLLTADWRQLEQMVAAQKELFPRVVGVKLYADNSTGEKGVTGEKAQALIYDVLAKSGYTGVVVVHAEDALVNASSSPFDYRNPISHAYARPWQSEVASIAQQIGLAEKANFKGKLHFAHVSVPASVQLINHHRGKHAFLLSCELTPHHALLYATMMDSVAMYYQPFQTLDELYAMQPVKNGLDLKMNPPLRNSGMAGGMLSLLLDGSIDCIATDHAPHTLAEKRGKSAASGIPGLPFYPVFIDYLLTKAGMPEQQLWRLTHESIVELFGLEKGFIPNTKRLIGPEAAIDLAKEYEFDPFGQLRQYMGR